eukprot:15484495-Alexandrium_andersonii.AAC.1
MKAGVLPGDAADASQQVVALEPLDVLDLEGLDEEVVQPRAGAQRAARLREAHVLPTRKSEASPDAARAVGSTAEQRLDEERE